MKHYIVELSGYKRRVKFDAPDDADRFQIAEMAKNELMDWISCQWWEVDENGNAQVMELHDKE